MFNLNILRNISSKSRKFQICLIVFIFVSIFALSLVAQTYFYHNNVDAIRCDPQQDYNIPDPSILSATYSITSNFYATLRDSYLIHYEEDGFSQAIPSGWDTEQYTISVDSVTTKSVWNDDFEDEIDDWSQNYDDLEAGKTYIYNGNYRYATSQWSIDGSGITSFDEGIYQDCEGATDDYTTVSLDTTTFCEGTGSFKLSRADAGTTSGYKDYTLDAGASRSNLHGFINLYSTNVTDRSVYVQYDVYNSTDDLLGSVRYTLTAKTGAGFSTDDTGVDVFKIGGTANKWINGVANLTLELDDAGGTNLTPAQIDTITRIRVTLALYVGTTGASSDGYFDTIALNSVIGINFLWFTSDNGKAYYDPSGLNHKGISSVGGWLYCVKTISSIDFTKTVILQVDEINNEQALHMITLSDGTNAKSITINSDAYGTLSNDTANVRFNSLQNDGYYNLTYLLEVAKTEVTGWAGYTPDRFTTLRIAGEKPTISGQDTDTTLKTFSFFYLNEGIYQSEMAQKNTGAIILYDDSGWVDVTINKTLVSNQYLYYAYNLVGGSATIEVIGSETLSTTLDVGFMQGWIEAYIDVSPLDGEEVTIRLTITNGTVLFDNTFLNFAGANRDSREATNRAEVVDLYVLGDTSPAYVDGEYYYTVSGNTETILVVFVCDYASSLRTFAPSLSANVKSDQESAVITSYGSYEHEITNDGHSLDVDRENAIIINGITYGSHDIWRIFLNENGVNTEVSDSYISAGSMIINKDAFIDSSIDVTDTFTISFNLEHGYTPTGDDNNNYDDDKEDDNKIIEEIVNPISVIYIDAKAPKIVVNVSLFNDDELPVKYKIVLQLTQDDKVMAEKSVNTVIEGKSSYTGVMKFWVRSGYYILNVSVYNLNNDLFATGNALIFVGKTDFNEFMRDIFY